MKGTRLSLSLQSRSKSIKEAHTQVLADTSRGVIGAHTSRASVDG